MLLFACGEQIFVKRLIGFACEHLSGIKKCFSFASLVYLLNFCIRRSSCFRMPSRVLSQVVIAGSWSRLADCIIVKAAIKLS